MSEINSIYFNNKNSFTDMGLIMERKPLIPVSLENVETIQIEGRSGDLVRKLGTWNDKMFPITFKLKTDSNFYRKVDEVIEWLNNIEDEYLIVSADPERKYRVKRVQGLESITRLRKWSDAFQVTFVCEPFKYPIEDTVITSTSASFSLYNFGSVKSEPYIKITGSGNITLTINNKSIIFTGVSEYIELDSMFFLCHKGTTNEMLKMNGDFPVLEKGSNSISATGTVTSIEVHVREKYW